MTNTFRKNKESPKSHAVSYLMILSASLLCIPIWDSEPALKGSETHDL